MYKRCFLNIIALTSILTIIFIVWFIAVESGSHEFDMVYKYNENNVINNDFIYGSSSHKDWIMLAKPDRISYDFQGNNRTEAPNVLSRNYSLNLSQGKHKQKDIERTNVHHNFKNGANKNPSINSKFLQMIRRLSKKIHNEKSSIENIYKNDLATLHHPSPKKQHDKRVDPQKQIRHKARRVENKVVHQNPQLKSIEKRILEIEKAQQLQARSIEEMLKVNVPLRTNSRQYRRYKVLGNDFRQPRYERYGHEGGRYEQSDGNFEYYNEIYRKQKMERYVRHLLHDSLKDKYMLPKNMKKILIYSRLWSQYEWDGIPHEHVHAITRKYRCPASNCVFTYDRQNFNQSDAILFHHPDERRKSYILNLLNKYGGRQANQRWIFFTSETPTSDTTVSDLQGLDEHLFNTTMTYSSRSDIFIPYGRYRQHNKHDKIPKLRNFAKGKLNGAVWYVSNCGAQPRKDIVEILQNYIPIYVGGNCAENYENQTECEKTDAQSNIHECSADIKRFKFYLSFESAICDDYVTEKYWDNAIKNEVLPVVLNGADIKKDKRVLIPGSYIDVLDFQSIDELGKHLQLLLSNDVEYNKYFKWKKKYRMIKRQKWPYAYELVCSLCAYVTHHRKRKVYNSIAKWWAARDCNGERLNKINSMVEQHWEKFPRKTYWSNWFDGNNVEDDMEYEPYDETNYVEDAYPNDQNE